MRFLTLSPKAQDYYQGLRQRRFNPSHHLRKIVALSDIYGAEGVARAMEDAFTFQAFSHEYIANLLESRARPLCEPSALHLTRRQSEIKKYLKPRVLLLDELGYLPIDKTGADLLFQVISGRYEPESQGCDAFMRYRRNVALLSSPPTVLSRSGPRSSTTTAP